MSYLIDTRTLLWYFKGDLQLSKTANEILEDGKKQKYVSMASLWEIAIKVNIERLQLDYPFADIEHKLKFENIGILNISFLHTQHVLNLPLHHRDPFRPYDNCTGNYRRFNHHFKRQKFFIVPN
jgi:PIN domain nuclease of toxin-antitoxin system